MSELFQTYPGGSVATSTQELRIAASRAVVLADADASAFIDRTRWYGSTDDLKAMAFSLSNQIASSNALTGRTPNTVIRSNERSMPNRAPRLKARIA